MEGFFFEGAGDGVQDKNGSVPATKYSKYACLPMHPGAAMFPSSGFT